MPQLKFYYAPGACSLAPHILLHEVGLPFDAIANEVTQNGANFIEGFHRINPKMRIPVIALDGEVITETIAVMTAIANLAPEKHLLGQTPLETLRVYEWMAWLSGTVHGQGFGELARPERFSDDPAAHDGIRAKGHKTIVDCYDMIEGKLTGVYAVGDSLTLVDPYLFVFFRWGNGLGLAMKEKYPNWAMLVSNLVKRSAVEAALKAENIDSTL
ncbi:glutathione S-transferase [Coleophoma cylindrospora]|uniref:Glutathione S-transferase n=1 Tax=Coleophoma cylindrospora TaxID=1849047 RepID=A0A3D8QP29_9HELO|nr:glutathione S-transferase [Coleophoma cylindrospora]